MDAPPQSKSGRVSVVIPAYNAASFIAETLTSILNQDGRHDLEIAVVNDGSPDTPQLEAALEPFQGCILYLNQPNRGPSAARNAGIEATSGSLVAFLDADDLWEKDFLDCQTAVIKRGFDLAWGNAVYFGEGDWVGQTYMDLTPHPDAASGEATLVDLLARRAVINTSTILARREAILRGGLFPEEFRYNEDLYFWLRMVQSGARAHWTRRVLSRFRRHSGGNLTSNRLAMWDQLAVVLATLERELPYSGEELAASRATRELAEAHCSLERGRAALLQGDDATAAALLSAAAGYFQTPKLRGTALAARWFPSLLRRIAQRPGRL